MTINKAFSIFFLILVSFAVAGGCNNNNSGGGTEPLPGEEEEVETGVFNLELAIELGELSLVAYEQRLQCINTGKSAITVPSPYKLEKVIFEGVNSFFNDTCKDDSGVIPIAFIATEGSSIYLVFRGTANVADALSDLAVEQEDYKFIPMGGKVSGGFQETYEGSDANPIEGDIITELDELIKTGSYDTLYITGHSLGAAVAVLAFPDLTQNTTIKSVTMYNFAGPGVGNSDFTSAYEAEYDADHVSWRVVNTNDLVPKLPPLGLDCTDLMYVHTANEHQITFGVTLPPLPDFTKAMCDQATIAGDLAEYGFDNKSDIEEDHSMCTYFMTLCMKGSDPSTCSMRAVGCDGEDDP